MIGVFLSLGSKADCRGGRDEMKAKMVRYGSYDALCLLGLRYPPGKNVTVGEGRRNPGIVFELDLIPRMTVDTPQLVRREGASK